MLRPGPVMKACLVVPAALIAVPPAAARALAMPSPEAAFGAGWSTGDPAVTAHMVHPRSSRRQTKVATVVVMVSVSGALPVSGTAALGEAQRIAKPHAASSVLIGVTP